VLRFRGARNALPEGFDKDIALLWCRTKGYRGHWALRLTPSRAILHELAGNRELAVKAAFTGRLVSLPSVLNPGTMRIKAEGHDLFFAPSGYGAGRFYRWVHLSRSLVDPKTLSRRQQSGLLAVVFGIVLAGSAVTVGRSRGSALVDEFGGVAPAVLFLLGLAGLALLVTGLVRVIESVVLMQQAKQSSPTDLTDDSNNETAEAAQERKKIHYPRQQEEPAPPPVAQGRRLADMDTTADEPQPPALKEADTKQQPQDLEETEKTTETSQNHDVPKTPARKRPERKVIPLRRSAPGNDPKPEQ
jgi:hypothetical protein